MTGKAKRQIILVSWGNALITLSEEICSGHYVCDNSTICVPSPTMSSIGPLEPSLSLTPPVDLVEVRASGGCHQLNPNQPSVNFHHTSILLFLSRSSTPPVDLVKVRASGSCHLIPQLAFLPIAPCFSSCWPYWIPLPKSNQLHRGRSRWGIHGRAPTAHSKCWAIH